MTTDSTHPHRLLGPVPTLCLALALCAAAFLCQRAPKVAAAESSPSEAVTSAKTSLSAATTLRETAETRSEQLLGQVVQLETEAARLGKQDAALSADLVASRQRLRDYAVAAYIDGGQSAIFRASLSPKKAVALSWQSSISIGQSSSANQAARRLEDLKASVAPSRVAAAEQLESASRALVEARFDTIQAAGFERDAEAKLAEAERQQAEAAAAEAAEAAAAQAKRVAAEQADQNSSPTNPQSTPQSSDQPAPPNFGLLGNPTAEESAILAKIRRCESRGNYAVVSATGRYRGAYQFDFTTWRGVGGSGDPAAASPAEQDYRALLLLRLRGRRPWPVCGK